MEKDNDDIEYQIKKSFSNHFPFLKHFFHLFSKLSNFQIIFMTIYKRKIDIKYRCLLLLYQVVKFII